VELLVRKPAVLALLLSSACAFSVNPNVGYFTCASNVDCGSGWHCNSTCPVPGFNAYCVEDGYCDPCPDTKSDPKNCGACGEVCGATESCINAVCIGLMPPDGG
jgi:hypothetical protein